MYCQDCKHELSLKAILIVHGSLVRIYIYSSDRVRHTSEIRGGDYFFVHYFVLGQITCTCTSSGMHGIPVETDLTGANCPQRRRAPHTTQYAKPACIIV